jgi:hypothetical protein
VSGESVIKGGTTMNRWISKGTAATVAAAALLSAGWMLSQGRADDKPAAPPAEKDDVPTLKKSRTKNPLIGGYLGMKDIQEKLGMSAEEKAKIAETQKWHSDAEEKLYVEYEDKLRKILGDDRWKKLAKLVDDKRDELSEKRKKYLAKKAAEAKGESPKPEAKSEEKPAEKKE